MFKKKRKKEGGREKDKDKEEMIKREGAKKEVDYWHIHQICNKLKYS